VDRVPYGLGPQFGSKTCAPCPTNRKYEQNPVPTIPCLCMLPLGVGIRLKSPGISDFRPYKEALEIDLRSAALDVGFSQLYIERYLWEPGPRLSMHFKLFPRETTLFNVSEVLRLRKLFAGWSFYQMFLVHTSFSTSRLLHIQKVCGIYFCSKVRISSGHNILPEFFLRYNITQRSYCRIIDFSLWVK
jgi:hypothetical protein